MLLALLLVLSELGCVNTFSGVSCLVDVSSPSGPSGLADHSKKHLNFPIVFAWKFRGNGQFSLGN